MAMVLALAGEWEGVLTVQEIDIWGDRIMLDGQSVAQIEGHSIDVERLRGLIAAIRYDPAGEVYDNEEFAGLRMELDDMEERADGLAEELEEAKDEIAKLEERISELKAVAS